MNKIKNNSIVLLLKYQLPIGLSTLFFILLFKYVGGIYTALNYKDLSLANLNEKSALAIQKKIETSLINSHFNNILFRYGVFFYVDDFEKRIAFINSDSRSFPNKALTINKDSFYKEMLANHKEDICFVKNTKDIPISSGIYGNLYSKGDIKLENFYVSCPIYLEDSLVGYIGGLYKQTKEPIFIDMIPIKDGATLIEGVLLKD